MTVVAQKKPSASIREFFSVKKNLQQIFTRPDHQLKPLDGLRALSILFVITFHVFFFAQYTFAKGAFLNFTHELSSYLNWVWHGDKGVDLFFILSGFLITSMLIKDHQKNQSLNFRRFYTHRMLRILPVYVFAVLLYGLPGGNNAENFWANLLFINNLLPAEEMFIPWSWSLSVEVQFYFIFPLLLWFFYKTKQLLLLLISLFFTAVIYRYIVILQEADLYLQPIAAHIIEGTAGGNSLLFLESVYINLSTRIGPILLGSIMACLHHYHPEKVKETFAKHPHAFNLLFLFCLAGIITILYLPVFDIQAGFSASFNLHYLATNRNIFSLFVAILLMGAIYQAGISQWLNRFLSMPCWYPIAQTSYAMYLFHIPFVFLAFYLIHGEVKDLHTLAIDGLVLTVFLGTLFTFIFSCLVYIFIEKPFIHLYRKHS